MNANLPLEDALTFFYESKTDKLISQGSQLMTQTQSSTFFHSTSDWSLDPLYGKMCDFFVNTLYDSRGQLGFNLLQLFQRIASLFRDFTEPIHNDFSQNWLMVASKVLNSPNIQLSRIF